MAWPKKEPRKNECGHPEREHKGYGMCQPCLTRWKYANLPEEKKEIIRARSRARSKLEYVKYQRKISKRYRERYIETKKIILDRYGKECVCCGESEFHFLTLDHINRDGARHRKEIGGRSGYNLYRWLVNNGLPDGLVTMCYNCNCGRERNGGICPHKEKGNAIS